MSDYIKISMWGMPGTGKTTYLASLYDRLEFEHKITWDTRFYDDEGNLVFTEDFKGIVANLVAGNLPEATEASALQYLLLGKKKRLITTNHLEFNVIDASGGLVSTELGADQARHEDYYQQVRESNAIFLLIDPDKSQQTIHYYQLFNELFQRLRNDTQQTIPHYIAVCITKIDLNRHWQYRYDPEAYAKEILQDRAYNLLIQTAKRNHIKFFAISSIGRYPANDDAGHPNLRQVLTNQGGIQPQYDMRYRIAKPDLWQPYQVVEPFKWVVKHFGITL